MRADGDMDLIWEKYTGEIIGCAIEVINHLGHGFVEKPYENALCVEFGLRGILFKQQERFEIHYKSREVGVYIPDLIAFDKIIIEIKSIDRITAQEKGQILNYLRVAGYKVGLIMNFKHPRLEWSRFVL